MKKLSVIVFVFAVILAVVVGIFAPDAEFDYLFGTVKYFPVFILVALCAVALFFTSGNQKRESKVYLNSNGEFDTETPREYTPMKINGFSKFTGKANMFGQRNLKVFRYNNGTVYVENSKGESLEAPLSQLTFTYKKDKNKVTDEWYVYQYRLADNNGNKVQFNYHSMLFNDEEYDDMLMLLSLAANVKETGLSKATQIADSVIGSVEDIADGNIVNSVMAVGDVITNSREVIMAKIGADVKQRYLDKMHEDEEDENPKKKSFFKKLTEWFFIAVLVIYVILVIIVNVEPLFTSGSSDENTEIEMTEEVVTDNADETDEYGGVSKEEYSSEGDSYGMASYSGTYTGKIGGKYSIIMYLKVDDNGHVSGKYQYSTSGDEWLNLSGELVDGADSYIMNLTDMTGDGQVVGYFELSEFTDTSDGEGFGGTYVNYKDQEFDCEIFRQ